MTERFVVDASVALKWVLDEPDSALAMSLLYQPLSAPDWWLVEAGNALWKACWKSEISAEEAVSALEQLETVPIEAFATPPLLTDALRIATRLRHPIYDCAYLALAIRLDARVVTADTRFVRAAGHEPDLAARLLTLEAWGGLRG